MHERTARARPVGTVDLAAPEALAPTRFAAQIRATPTSVALVAPDVTLTYAQLHERIDAMASRLLAEGVDDTTCVGLALDRTSHLVTALWACLRLGVPYVPLDPSYPRGRLDHMVRDAGVGLLVADDVGLASLDAWTGLPVLDPDGPERSSWSPPLEGRPASSRSGVRAGDLAYVIYTSGSTGPPKGVQVDQGNLAHFLAAMGAAVRPAPSGAGVFLASTTLSFDPSVVELVWSLTTGFTVVLSPSLAGPAAHRASLGTLIERHGVTHAQLTPSRARVLLADDDERRALGRLDQLFVGGEVLTPGLAADLLAAGVGTVTNLYGPTETTVWAFAHHVTGDPAAVRAAGSVPVGGPLPGYTHRIVDAEGASVADGRVGELWIGGAGVTRGYRNRPAHDAGPFVDDASLGGAYRTGDLTRAEPGGVVFVGRTDDQVKVDGYRIELGEVERGLAGSPGTAQVVVAARGAPHARLVAYVVPAGDAPRDRDAMLRSLREHGAASLPGYMLPTALVRVDAFELTPSGKVDRARLPDPDVATDVLADVLADAGSHADPPTGRAPDRRPRTGDLDEVRATLAVWWADLLGRHRVRTEEDFFDLGGDSTLAVRLLARVQRSWGIRLGLATLVAAPTPQLLAEVVVRAAGAGGGGAVATPAGASCLVPFAGPAAPVWGDTHGAADRNGRGRRPLVVVHGSGGNVLNLTAMARHLGEMRPFVGVQARGVDGVSEPDPSIEAMTERYIDELVAYQPDGPYLLGGYSGGGVVAIEMARRLQLRGAYVPVVLLFDSYPPGQDQPGLPGKLGNVVRSVRHHGVPAVARSLAVILRRRMSGEVVADARALGYGDVTELGLATVDGHFNRLVARHQPVPVDVRTVLFRAEIIQASLPPVREWRRLLTRPPEVRTVPGHHYSMFDPAHAGALAAAVEDVLASADPD